MPEYSRIQTDVVRMNGAPVRVAEIFRHRANPAEGLQPDEFHLVVMQRGAMAHRSFRALLERGPVILEVPPANEPIETEVVSFTFVSTGGGYSDIFRHDLTLRELASSAERRAAARAAAEAARQAEAGAIADAADDVGEVDAADEDEDPNAPLDLSSIRVSAPAETWADSLRRLKEPERPAASSIVEEVESPLAPAELAGIEAVLVGLRLEALIEVLDGAGVIRRSAVDDAFLRLLQERFIGEATPVVGEEVAKRAIRDVLGS